MGLLEIVRTMVDKSTNYRLIFTTTLPMDLTNNLTTRSKRSQHATNTILVKYPTCLFGIRPFVLSAFKLCFLYNYVTKSHIEDKEFCNFGMAAVIDLKWFIFLS